MLVQLWSASAPTPYITPNLASYAASALGGWQPQHVQHVHRVVGNRSHVSRCTRSAAACE